MPASNSVDLLLLRHGIAEERLGGLDHPDRALTARGRLRTRAVIDALVCRGVRVERLITSPYRRALETAQIACEAGLSEQQLEQHPGLQPGGAADSLVQDLSGRVGLVGHEPDLSHLACSLLGLVPGSLVLRKAGVIQLRGSGGSWQLDALLRPGLLLGSDPPA
jgi:phosphohistidine phosphatase